MATQKELALALETSIPTFRNWKDKGCPDEIDAALAWRDENCAKNASGHWQYQKPPPPTDGACPRCDSHNSLREREKGEWGCLVCGHVAYEEVDVRAVLREKYGEIAAPAPPPKQQEESKKMTERETELLRTALAETFARRESAAAEAAAQAAQLLERERELLAEAKEIRVLLESYGEKE